ncbi:MAG: anaerobic glycerol-3-phosphate dehydrogenase subunit A [Caldilineaceae bacterium]|nr:anaerobic glycerol-3-phosphate dehydrogenase subunit A [Caldilineaceae bacterium]MBP8108044.1 anaerobic glycerol-3-phosphate dehydrogenase subunit A [Caldilineaceae bacterium]MBP8124859.1 anaerobic glycerol-3-phosphate dehydrogenase subunit A [Caldilineaceae bacterium]MBP9072839.1 anaerobic glycerol-3-phosphate dehydrogenase subunit A [Caldilineaceae bacterium]
MKKIQTEILVIGGGATGTGIAWDAALRGYQVVLVERRDLTHGTTGRYHGLLHSGGRYVVKDPQSAVECIAENRTLRKTHAHCIEDTGGFFVVTPEDVGAYPDQFVAACAATGVPCNEISVKEALHREPLLNPRISRVFEVPDGAADSFLATHATAQAARMAGAQILTYHEVQDLIMAGGEGDKRVIGARVRDAALGEDVAIHAQLVISATGAWANAVAHMAGIDLSVIPGKGTMVAMNHRMLNTVINRCKMPDDGDIIVPIHTVAVIGTTDQRVADPENLRIDSWEVQFMLEEGDKMIPGISKARVVRAWAGVRPLYQEDYAGDSRDATRQFALLDHKARHNVPGLLTITGGKWTTFRLMAEKTVDLAAEHLGARKPCITAHTPVPGADQGPYWLGHRLHEVEETHAQGQLVCECELVTRAMLENAARQNPTLTLDDLRRDVRLGMGPCQGGFCTYRAVGILHEIDHADTSAAQEFAEHGSAWDVATMQSPKLSLADARPSLIPKAPNEDRAEVFNPNLLLRDFLQERWKGVSPILWGQQLKQERLDELIYLTTMNVDHLPNADLSSPVTDFYNFDATPNDKLEVPHD